MKYFNRFLSALSLGLLISGSSWADVLNRHNMLPNSIPESVTFLSNETTAELFFQPSTLPARFSCYFSPSDNQKHRGLIARFMSSNARISFQPGVPSSLIAGGNEVKIFTVTAARNSNTLRSVMITLEGDSNRNTPVTLFCAMQRG